MGRRGGMTAHRACMRGACVTGIYGSLCIGLGRRGGGVGSATTTLDSNMKPVKDLYGHTHCLGIAVGLRLRLKLS